MIQLCVEVLLFRAHKKIKPFDITSREILGSAVSATTILLLDWMGGVCGHDRRVYSVNSGRGCIAKTIEYIKCRNRLAGKNRLPRPRN